MKHTFPGHIGFVVAAFGLLLTACGGPSVNGTYQDAGGMTVLELKSGGDASITMMGEPGPCASYSHDGNTVTLQCDDGPLTFTINGDGSLTAPPGSFVGALRRMD